jgi:hypothetical protein
VSDVVVQMLNPLRTNITVRKSGMITSLDEETVVATLKRTVLFRKRRRTLYPGVTRRSPDCESPRQLYRRMTRKSPGKVEFRRNVKFLRANYSGHVTMGTRDWSKA